MSRWIYGVILLVGLASPSIVHRVARRGGREPHAWAPLGRGVVGRFLLEGRTRFVGYALQGVLWLVILLGAAWYFSQPNWAKGSDQMHAAPGIPAWVGYPLAVVAWIALMADLIYTNERFESGRRRRLREPATATSSARATR